MPEASSLKMGRNHKMLYPEIHGLDERLEKAVLKIKSDCAICTISGKINEEKYLAMYFIIPEQGISGKSLDPELDWKGLKQIIKTETARIKDLSGREPSHWMTTINFGVGSQHHQN